MNTRRFAAGMFLFAVVCSSLDAAPRVRRLEMLKPVGVRDYGEPPLRTASAQTSPTIASLPPAVDGDVAALRSWNRSGNTPARVGLVRELGAAVAVRAPIISIASNGPWHWRGSVRVDSASRLRLRLDDVQLPAGSRLWVYGAGTKAVGFDASIAHERTIWTPSIATEEITLELESPGTNASFRIGAVADIRSPEEVFPQDTSCIRDASCFNGLAVLAKAIGFYGFVNGDKIGICTGGLLNTMTGGGTPLFLTANHCMENQTQVASMETFWDYRTASCNAPDPPLETLQSTISGTLLVTSRNSDVTLVRLPSLPPGRVFLGWDATPVPNGTELLKLSHPNGVALRYSRTAVETTIAACENYPRPQFIYSVMTFGATDGGSSGAPLMDGEGTVYGQLKGACGPEPDNACNNLNREQDGSFQSSFPLLQQYLDPQPQQCSACVPNANTACMLNGRFKVSMTWRDTSANLSGNGSIITYNDNRSVVDPTHGEVSQSTFWSMYSFSPNSIEALVRMLRGFNTYWVFVTGFASAEYIVTIEDTKTCAKWQRTMATGTTTMIKDFNAFNF